MNLAIIRFSCAENVIWCPRNIAITVSVPAMELRCEYISPAYYPHSLNKYITFAHVGFRLFTKSKTIWNANIYIGIMVRFTVNLCSEIDDCILFLHQNNRQLDVRKRKGEEVDCIWPVPSLGSLLFYTKYPASGFQTKDEMEIFCFFWLILESLAHLHVFLLHS